MVVLIGATDVPFRKAMAEVTYGMLRDAGFNAEFQALDWGAMGQRREKRPDRQGRLEHPWVRG